jgi:hypothetical protein
MKEKKKNWMEAEKFIGRSTSITGSESAIRVLSISPPKFDGQRCFKMTLIPTMNWKHKLYKHVSNVEGTFFGAWLLLSIFVKRKLDALSLITFRSQGFFWQRNWSVCTSSSESVCIGRIILNSRFHGNVK